MSQKFEYKYSAPTEQERREILSIKNSYEPKDSKMLKLEQLRKLDFRVKNIPTLVALVVGILGLLIFGVGLTMVLEWNLTIWGIIVGAVGVIVMSPAYFVNNLIYKKLKSKYSDEILNLSNELLNENEQR